MRTPQQSGAATFREPGCYDQSEQRTKQTSEWVYQGITLAAMLIVLASLWIF